MFTFWSVLLNGNAKPFGRHCTKDNKSTPVFVDFKLLSPQRSVYALFTKCEVKMAGY